MSPNGKAAIIARLLEHCQRKEQLPLDFLKLDEDVLELASMPDEIFNVLMDEFSLVDLMESGIVIAAEDETVALAPALANGATFVVLREAVTDQPYELLTSSGCLFANALPVLEVLRDNRTQRLLQEANGDLFVACDIDHVAMLRACGLPATLADGLDDLQLDMIERFSEVFGATSYGSPRMTTEELGAAQGHVAEHNPEDPIRHMMRSKTDDEAGGSAQLENVTKPSARAPSTQQVEGQLVFLAWAPLQLSSAVPIQLTAIFESFRQLEQFVHLDLRDIGLWEVDEDTIKRLQFIADRRSPEYFKMALLDATDSIGVGIQQFGKENALAIRPPDEYAIELSRLHECVSIEYGTRFSDPNQINEAWRDVQRLLNQQVLNPVRELALATVNPIERNLLMGFAELSHVFHLQSLVAGGQLSRRIADRGVEYGGQLPEDQFKNLMAMADRLIGLAKATERCNRPQATIIQTRSIDTTSTPRLPHCD